ncbi:MAG: PilN domain-containing protein [Deltaproteobacteria bacterium]|nr:PilN domain-containing protein [Deltaproteobacteria bacterium]
MTKIHIDLSTKRHRRLSVPVWVTAAFAVCAAVYSAYNAYGYFAARSFMAENSAYLVNAKAPSIEEAMRIKDETVAVNSIIGRKAFSWTTLLTHIEESVPASVTIVDIAPEPESGNVEINAMASSFDDAMSFVEKLSKSGRFSEAFLKAHDEKTIGGAKKIMFSVHAVYKGRA